MQTFLLKSTANVNFKVTVDRESNPENPRENNKCDSEMVIDMKHYHYADNSKSIKTIRDLIDYFSSDSNPISNTKDLIKAAEKQGYVLLPIWGYLHSNLTLMAGETNPFADSWDSGIAGFIWEKFDQTTKDEALEHIFNDVDDFNKYSNGDIYEISIECFSLKAQFSEYITGIIFQQSTPTTAEIFQIIEKTFGIKGELREMDEHYLTDGEFISKLRNIETNYNICYTSSWIRQALTEILDRADFEGR